MSSAILYVAIVAIWACVLIPRWLRRDSARGAGNSADQQVPGDVVRGDVVTEDAEVLRTPDVTVEAEADSEPEEVPEPDAERRVPPPLPPVPPEESRRRMLAARRRLLGMLIILEGAAIALAVLKFAALWVLIPPSIMLVGYMLLLREAAHADAERARHEEEAARARVRAQERARERAAQRAAATPPAPAVPVTPAAPPAPAVPAARYEDAGRDFAPGLAGKYTTSNDEYSLERLRAVGD